MKVKIVIYPYLNHCSIFSYFSLLLIIIDVKILFLTQTKLGVDKWRVQEEGGEAH